MNKTIDFDGLRKALDKDGLMMEVNVKMDMKQMVRILKVAHDHDSVLFEDLIMPLRDEIGRVEQQFLSSKNDTTPEH